MEEPSHPPPVEQLSELIAERAHDDVAASLERYESADADERKRALRVLRDLAAERPAAFGPILPSIAPFLTDEERAVRLTVAKLFVAVAEAEPRAVVSSVSALADRLGDDDEFYYVRARSAEALGDVALEAPDVVASPELLAELRVGLSFDEAEVKAKLAKALEHVALGDPGRLKHQVSNLAEHLDDEIVSHLRDHDVASQLRAVQNDRVIYGGLTYQGPIIHLFQLERAAQELYPDAFGGERLVDRQRVADIVNGVI